MAIRPRTWPVLVNSGVRVSRNACPPRAGSDRAIRAPRSRDGRMSSSLSALVYVAIFGETHSGSGCPSHCVTNSAAAWIAVKRSSPEPVLVNP